MPSNSAIAGIDIGSSKVVAVIGEALSDGRVEVISVGTAESPGVQNGEVTDIYATVEAITKAANEASNVAGVPITDAIISVSGSHLRSLNSQGAVAIRGGSVTSEHIAQAMDLAEAIVMPFERESIHSIVRDFIIDNKSGIQKPLAMSGIKLEAQVFIITALKSVMENLNKCCEACNIGVMKGLPAAIASGDAVLSDAEKKLGVALVDIGAQTTDLIIYYNNVAVYSSVLELGGDLITTDIAKGMPTPPSEAEKLKIKWGSAIAEGVDSSLTIDVPFVGGEGSRPVGHKLFCSIIEARAEEILREIDKEIANSQFSQYLHTGIVFTGGATLLDGFLDLASSTLGRNVRMGIPTDISTGSPELLKDPRYATAIGLIKWGYSNMEKIKLPSPEKSFFKKLMEKLLGKAGA